MVRIFVCTLFQNSLFIFKILHQTFFDNFFLQYKHLYSIKSSLKFVYSKRQLHISFVLPQVSHFLSWCSYLQLTL